MKKSNPKSFVIFLFIICSIIFTFAFAAQSKKDKGLAYYHYIRGKLDSMIGNPIEAIEHFNKTLKYDKELVRPKLNLAIELYKIGKIEDALDYCEEIIKKIPDYVEAHNLKGKIFLLYNKPQKAIQAFSKAVELNTEDPEAYFDLGSIYFQKNEYDNAKNIFEKFIKIHPYDLQGHFFLAQAYFKLKDYEKSLNSFKKTLEMDPEYVSSLKNIGLIFELRKDRNMAGKYYEKVIKIEPDNLQYRNFVYEVFLENNDLEKAARILKETIEILPHNIEYRYKLGKLYYENKDWKKAKEVFKFVCEKYPREDTAKLFLAKIYEHTKEPLLAIKTLETIRPSSELYLEANKLLISLYLVNNKKALALSLAGKLKSKYLKNYDFLTFLATIYEKEKNYEEAVQVLQTALKYKPNNEFLFLGLASLFDKLNDYDNAVVYMKSVLKANPDNADALNYMGYYYLDKKFDPYKAKPYLLEALKLKPKDGFILDSVGWLYYHLKDYNNSLTYLIEASTYEKNEPLIFMHISSVYEAKGKAKETKENLMKALELAKKRKDKRLIGEIQKRLNRGKDE